MSLPISDSESDQVSSVKLGPVILLGSSLSRRQVQSGGKEAVQAEETVSHCNLAYRPPHLWGDFPSGSRAGASGCREAFGFHRFWEGNETWGVSFQATEEAWFWNNPLT